jgi:hypothetical protein
VSWEERAACAGKPVHWFIGGPEDVVDSRAAALCAVCPVRGDCYRAGRGEHGTWGGVDAQTRNGRSPRGLPFGLVSCFECGDEFERSVGGPTRCEACRRERARVFAAERQRKARAS